MNKLEYLKSIKGQLHSRWKRLAKKRVFYFDFEPKSKKGISEQEKKAFREAVTIELKEQKKKAHTKDIILELGFSVTEKNAPAIHTLAKNYLDLLHKELPSVDSHKNLLFKDDNQVKILIVNFNTQLDKEVGSIFIKSQSIGDFIKDLELVDSLDVEENYDVHYELDTSRDDLDDFLKSKDAFDSEYNKMEPYYRQRFQENFLKLHNVKTYSLVSLFKSRFAKYKDLSSCPSFKELIEENDRIITFSTNFSELGNSPQQEGDTKVFKNNVKDKLNKFKERYKILFPLLTPIRVNILFIPPKSNVADLDNLARYIVPFVNEVFQPPSNFLGYFRADSKSESPIPPNSISGYQIITIPRKESDDENGQILFIISEGYFSRDLWWEIEHAIDSWKDDD